MNQELLFINLRQLVRIILLAAEEKQNSCLNNQQTVSLNSPSLSLHASSESEPAPLLRVAQPPIPVVVNAGTTTRQVASAVEKETLEDEPSNKMLSPTETKNLVTIKVHNDNIISAILFERPDLEPLKIKAYRENVVVIGLGSKKKVTHCLKIKWRNPNVAENKWKQIKQDEYTFGKSMASHPNIIRYESFKFSRSRKGDQFELLMEDGGEQLMDLELSDEEIFLIMKQTASAGKHANLKKVFNPDFKSENVLWNRSTQTAKVIDFDVAVKKSTWFLHTPSYAIWDTVLGYTPPYSPPELLGVKDKSKVSESDLCIPNKIGVYCWGMTNYAKVGKMTPEMLKDEIEYKKKGKDYYEENFLKRVREVRKAEQDKDKKLKFVIEVLLACLEFDPIKRPTFEYLDWLLNCYKGYEMPRCSACKQYKTDLINVMDQHFCTICLVTMKEFNELTEDFCESLQNMGKGIIKDSLVDAFIEQPHTTIDALICRGDVLFREHNLETSLLYYNSAKELLTKCERGLIGKGDHKEKCTYFYRIIVMKRLHNVYNERKEFVKVFECIKDQRLAIKDSLGEYSKIGVECLNEILRLSNNNFDTIWPNKIMLGICDEKIEKERNLVVADYMSYYDRGRWRQNAGDYSGASEDFKEALKLCGGSTDLNKITNLKNWDLIKILQCIGYLYRHNGNIKEMLAHYKKAAEISDEIIAKEENSTVKTKLRYAEVLTLMDQLDESKKLLDNLKQRFAQKESIRQLIKSDIYIAYAILLVRVGMYKEAEAEFIACLDLRIKESGKENSYVAQAFNLYSDCLMMQGKHVEAMKHAKTAAGIRKKLFRQLSQSHIHP
eukprot:TRINITY_DN1722_c0_g1_i4.p1 TRINITY_DN1722_c0_g1~~TRINITY_DN1722_c0_g1_i4.p1  ORF type:complete len:835 (-),score=75.18 TRINITY_DN1722_c0_g1_i4:562-3066(-)